MGMTRRSLLQILVAALVALKVKPAQAVKFQQEEQVVNGDGKIDAGFLLALEVGDQRWLHWSDWSMGSHDFQAEVTSKSVDLLAGSVVVTFSEVNPGRRSRSVTLSGCF